MLQSVSVPIARETIVAVPQLEPVRTNDKLTKLSAPIAPGHAIGASAATEASARPRVSVEPVVFMTRRCRRPGV